MERTVSQPRGSVSMHHGVRENAAAVFEDDDIFCEEWEEKYGEDDDPECVLLTPSAPRPTLKMGVKSLLQGHRSPLDAAPVDELLRRTTAGGTEPAAQGGLKLSVGGEGAIRGRAGMITGDFEKLSPWWVEGWRERCYVLEDGKLLYFNGRRRDRPLGILDFRLLQFKVHFCRPTEKGPDDAKRSCKACVDDKEGTLARLYLQPLAFPSKVFAFRGPSREMELLASEVTKLAQSCYSALRMQERVVSVKDFWRYPYIDEEEFVQQVSSCDILLFRGKDGASSLQRMATGSMYDHVRLLLRGADGQVLLLEALGISGVSTCTWDEFRAANWDSCYDRLALRKVYFRRSPKQLQALERFVREVLGTKYSLTVEKLLKREESQEFDKEGNLTPCRGGSGNSVALLPEQRSFFCSELVAACLKRCGVLAGAASSSQYWPGSFSQFNPEPLPLHEDVHLGADQVIILK